MQLQNKYTNLINLPKDCTPTMYTMKKKILPEEQKISVQVY